MEDARTNFMALKVSHMAMCSWISTSLEPKQNKFIYKSIKPFIVVDPRKMLDFGE
jgi:hypothetical protein